MLLIDDILLAPFHGIFWICKEIHEAVQEELAGEADSIRMELSNLYMMLETGRISEKDFDIQEQKLLDRLDLLEADDTDEAEPEEPKVMQVGADGEQKHSTDG